MRLKRSASGDRLYRDIEVRVCLPEQKDTVWRRTCEARHGWTEEQLDGMIAGCADSAEKQWPTCEFRLVELAPNRVKFIYAGRKGTMKSLCPEVAQSARIAEAVCKRDGHNIIALPSSPQPAPNGMATPYVHLCSKCGLGVSEIRDQVEGLVNAHIGNEVNKRMQALAASVKNPAVAQVLRTGVEGGGTLEPQAQPVGEPGEKIIELPPNAASAQA